MKLPRPAVVLVVLVALAFAPAAWVASQEPDVAAPVPTLAARVRLPADQVPTPTDQGNAIAQLRCGWWPAEGAPMWALVLDVEPSATERVIDIAIPPPALEWRCEAVNSAGATAALNVLAPHACAGDANVDGRVNLLDFWALDNAIRAGECRVLGQP